MSLTFDLWLQVEARIAEEAERARHYLDPTTESRITKVRLRPLDRVRLHPP